MSVTIWGRPDSSSVAKVMWCTHELGVDVKRINWGGRFGGGDEPAYRALNPTGLIPTLQDEDGFVLWESHAILRYLAITRDASLYPPDPRVRAEIDCWMDWANSAALAVSRLRAAYRAPSARATEVAAAAAALAPHLAPLEDRLEGRDFVAGDEFTLADIPVGVWIHRWFRAPIDLPSTPNMMRWHKRLRQRDAFAAHVESCISSRPQSLGMGEDNA